MRIAFFLHTFPAVSETFILSQITGLLDLGHQVSIFAERRPHRDNREPVHPAWSEYDLATRTTYLDSEMPEASGYWSMPVWPVSGETWLPGAERSLANADRVSEALPAIRHCADVAPDLTRQVLDPQCYGESALSLEALYHLHSLMDRGQEFDIAHVHFGPVGSAFRFVRALWNVPLVVTFHGYDFSQYPLLHGSDVYQPLFCEADGILGISQYALHRLVSLGCAADKLHVLHTGVDPDLFPFRERLAQPNEPIRLLTVGRLVEKKGLEYSLRAVSQIRHQWPNLRYEIIGDGPLRSRLEKLVDTLGLQSVVNLRGSVAADAVRRSFAESHLFILASVTAADGDEEGIPVSLMEAQACGLPVLSTHHSGIPELVVNGESGILVAERNISELACQLRHLLQHPETWPAMGRVGRGIVELQFNIQQLNRDLVDFYGTVIDRFQRLPAARRSRSATS